jgi:ferredoxin
MLYINPEICIDCDACVKECPVEAIFVAEDVPEKWIDSIDLNKEMSKKYPVISIKAKPLKSASWID